MEHTMMLTNKGRCQSTGGRGNEGWDLSCLVNRLLLRDTDTDNQRWEMTKGNKRQMLQATGDEGDKEYGCTAVINQ